MDPDYQKFLYFTILMPSFSLSKNNIKFMSPNENIEKIPNDLQEILNAFGPPKIEM